MLRCILSSTKIAKDELGDKRKLVFIDKNDSPFLLSCFCQEGAEVKRNVDCFI